MSITRESILSYLQSNFGVDVSDVDESTELFSTGLLDSFSVADMLMFIEDNGKFIVEPEEITYDNIDSVEKILEYARKKSASATG